MSMPGQAEAQYNLGAAYYAGEGVPQNYEQAEANSDVAGEQGKAAPQGQPPDDQGAQADPDGSQRDMSAEEAQEMVDLVRDKARAAETMRQQWRQARMRDSAAEKFW